MSEVDSPAPWAEGFLGGRLRLHQPASGHRAGTDAVLLAAAAELSPGLRFVDVGAGVGTVGLALALREPTVRGVLLESHSDAARLARLNISANKLDQRVRVAQLDLFDRAACRNERLADAAELVVTNPPFFTAGTVRSSPHPARAAAHVMSGEIVDPHAAWIRRAGSLVAPGGRLVAIHRPSALPDLLRGLEHRFGAITLRPVLAAADQSAIRMLVAARRDTKAPLAILPPLILHRADGDFTAEMEALNAGATLSSTNENRPRRAG